MGGPGLEVIKFTFYVFMPMGFMVYFGGPGFYERYVADETYRFNAPPKIKVPTETGDVTRALAEFKEAREQRKRQREDFMKKIDPLTPECVGQKDINM
ncbi:hypothetical protein H4R99_007887 [Coemansia sp. RSA 1722]|nr:hypothetical protein LPJ57_006305 [Coemansia sp. RSA 486]KAJ1866706.1 hypothetical protein LPJ57_005957 [Coemansia sp. RSA 486]KAJ2222423.1 hypothetical protein IWW45_008611 [Coemansia sp. RSA 485]KAJ2588192.1 hypothetical protein H4R99_007887 [Coemansia sp. RSA 1722]KAJ2705228.1 hypothetical protein FB645_002626 [Coemansia sp. IMI 203386]